MSQFNAMLTTGFGTSTICSLLLLFVATARQPSGTKEQMCREKLQRERTVELVELGFEGFKLLGRSLLLRCLYTK